MGGSRLGNLGVNRRLYENRYLRCRVCAFWIHLALDIIQMLLVVKRIIVFRVTQRARNFLASGVALSSSRNVLRRVPTDGCDALYLSCLITHIEWLIHRNCVHLPSR
jgi:hypothetical protein